MCSAVRCRVCGKTTWSGCGQHIASVKATVPAGQWCPGNHTAAEKASAPSSGIFGRFFGR